jgi:hypothetical protein
MYKNQSRCYRARPSRYIACEATSYHLYAEDATARMKQSIRNSFADIEFVSTECRDRAKNTAFYFFLFI